MKKNISKIIFSLVFLISILQVFNFVNLAFAANIEEKTGLKTSAQVGYTGSASGEIKNSGVVLDIPSAIGKFIGAILSLLGVGFMLLIIYGGFTWMFARGNEQAVTKAKGIIEAAIIGLVIVLAAYAITSFISGSLTT